MPRRIGISAVAVLATAGVALPAAASARTKTVVAGPPGLGRAAKVLGKAFINKYSPDVNGFFLQRVTVNAGDTVAFVNRGFHTIDLPGSSGRDLPFIVPGAIATGVKDAAGNPFWFNGHVPSLGVNPQLFAGSKNLTYNGSNRIDSGLPSGSGPPKPMKVKFTKPGTYKYFCDVHPGMIGYVVVKPKGQPVPSARQDAAALNNQVNSVLRSIKKLAKTTTPADHVSIGAAASNGAELYAMFPSRLTVHPGTVVSFSMSRDSRETHTATFGPNPYLAKLAMGFQGAVFPPEATYPSDPVMPVTLSPTSHGNGFANTGVLDRASGTPPPSSAQVKFTTAGTYHYICLIHTNMQGTIIVR